MGSCKLVPHGSRGTLAPLWARAWQRLRNACGMNKDSNKYAYCVLQPSSQDPDGTDENKKSTTTKQSLVSTGDSQTQDEDGVSKHKEKLRTR